MMIAYGVNITISGRLSLFLDRLSAGMQLIIVD